MNVAAGDDESNRVTIVPGVDHKKHRVVFANQLRGLAALTVVASHLMGVFWSQKSGIAAATCSPQQPGRNPFLFWIDAHNWAHAGAFGVAVFFLISGFVIPISLKDHSRFTFIIARLLRIYPTYLVALAVNVTTIWLASHYWHIGFVTPPHTVRANIPLMQDWLGKPNFDLVSWTLCVELKFYVLMAAIAPAIRNGSVAVLFAVATGALAFNLALATPFILSIGAKWPSLLTIMSTQSMYIVFMLIGTLFNYRLRALISRPAFLASLAGLIFLFIACWRTSNIADQYPITTKNYLYAVVLFGILFAARRWIKETRLLDNLAAISFPFYLIHSLIGYTLLKLFMIKAGLPYWPALALTVPIVIGLGILLHVTVERWSIKAGKFFSNRPRLNAV